VWNTSFSGVFRSYSTPSPVTEIAIEIYVAYIGGVVGGVGGWGVCVCVRVSVCVWGGGGGDFARHSGIQLDMLYSRPSPAIY
jgi:hypothetical protein